MTLQLTHYLLNHVQEVDHIYAVLCFGASPIGCIFLTKLVITSVKH